MPDLIPVDRVGLPSRSVVSDEELRAHVREVFSEGVVGVERELSRYSTSATIEDVRVQRSDGQLVRLLLKDLSPAALLNGSTSKPAFIVDPRRELLAYRTVLRTSSGRGSAACLAAVDEGERQWLLLEKVPGAELYQVGDLSVWAASAAALAGLHQDLHAALGGAPALRHLLVGQEPGHLRRWMRRAMEFDRARGGVHRTALAKVARAHEDVVDRLCALPPVLLHGDLYASNVLVVLDQPLRVCAVDWELASLGPAVLDLAALVSGGWTDEDRETMVAAYWSTMDDPRWRPDALDFGAALDAARLQLCVQWLGWAQAWSPPQEHAQDWLGEASALAERLVG